MRWTVGTKISGGYALAFTLLVIIGVISYMTTDQLKKGIDLVEKTHGEIVMLNGIVSQLYAGESAERAYVITGKDEYLNVVNIMNERVPEDLKEIRMLMRENPVLLQKLTTLESVVNDKLDRITLVAQTRKDSGEDAAKVLVITINSKTSTELIANAVTDIENELKSLLSTRQAAEDQSSGMIFNIIVIGIPISLMIIGAAGFFIVRGITIPLKETTELAERIAGGDLSKSPGVVKRQDEIGALFRAFDTMIGSLREINREIFEGVNVISSASSEIMASTAQVASGAMETSSAISETTSSVEEVKQSAQLASDKSRAVSDVTRATVQVSESGIKSVEQSVVGMNRIQEQVESIAQSLVQLSEQSQAIGEIIASVNDLAEQSNLLAVNAAIEAAKAGDQGKGFTVVAQEVKVLAEQSKEATAQVRTILNDIMKAINSAVMATEQGSKAVDAGVLQSMEAGETIRQMADGIGNAAQMVIQISVSSQQQLVGMDQIAMAMENIRQASEQNVSGTKQVEYTVQNLHELGQRLKQTVERYRL